MIQMQRFFWVSMALCFFLFSLTAQGQDETPEKKRKGLVLRKFIPTDSATVMKTPRLYFKHINEYRYYYNEKELKKLQELRESKDWTGLYHATKAYVEQFGIENFKRDMNMVWHLARLAEHEEEFEVAKDVWRCIMKHHKSARCLTPLRFYDHHGKRFVCKPRLLLRFGRTKKKH
jgi:hypothetical protein